MKQLSLSRLVAVACILCAGSAGASAAQTSKHGGDPSRWYHGDSTQQQRMAVLKKELSAAYADQQAACRHQPSGERASCLREARANYRHDSANARQLVAHAPQSEVSERIVTTTPAGGTGTEPGATAYGSSGAGATGSGQGQSGAGMSGAQQSGGTSQSTGTSGAGATGAAGSMNGATGMQPGMHRDMQPGMHRDMQPGMHRDMHPGMHQGMHPDAGAAGSSGTSGTTGSGQDQGAAPVNEPSQSGSNNGNETTQPETQGQPGTGTAPPLER